MCKSFMRYKSHRSSQVAAARVRYSASGEDLDNVNCFFVLYDISDLTRKKHWSETDLLVSMHPAQSVISAKGRVLELKILELIRYTSYEFVGILKNFK